MAGHRAIVPVDIAIDCAQGWKVDFALPDQLVI